MVDTSFARDRFASLSTEELTEIWSTDGREPWAEEILRKELLTRGVPEQWLISTVPLRESISKQLEDERSFNRLGSVTGAFASLGAAAMVASATAMYGERGGLWAGVLLSATYLVILGRMVVLARHELRATRELKAVLWFLLQGILAVSVFGGCIYGLVAKA